jgi:tetratricopeptide (TPR) repeat protein
MQNGESQPQPLLSDTKRQAIPPLRGFEYQIWQSVLQWVTLKPGQALFLEGAEDFDLVNAGHAETVQVKDTAGSGTVSLNSGSVVQAIAHFWEHQTNNPSFVIYFRFLTTSKRGMEQSSSFGNVRGLDHWDRCKRPHSGLAELRTFLLTKDALPTELKDFISSASDSEMRERLIQRVTWETGQGDHAAIKEVIRRRVVGIGAELFSVPPYEAEKVVPYLFTHAFEVARDKADRQLDVTEFLELLQTHSTIRISRSELDQRRPASSGHVNLGGAEQAETVEFITEPPEAYALPPFDRMAQRKQIVDDLIKRLNVRGILVINGSTGTGKSTLAALIARKEGENWQRFDLREWDPKRMSEHLIRATLADRIGSQEVDYIIDDLSFDGHSSSFERPLAAFLHTVTARGGRVVLTTQGELPSRLALAFDLPEGSHFTAPWLTEEEVEEIAIAHGCPVGRKLQGWRRIIHINALGHPQLVHARVKNVAASGWPTPKLEDIIAQEDVANVRREVRQRLQAQLPSDQARTLAYRLDTFSLHFRREHALFIAQHPPALPNPGEIFDLLVGPWVEQVDSKYYRLSPLLRNSAREVFGSDQVKNLHKTATYGFLAGMKSISQFELNGVLFHGILGDEARPLDVVARNIGKIKDEDWPLVAEEIDWITFVALGPGEKLFKSNPFTSLMLRNLQFRVAAASSPDRLSAKVLAAWERELDDFGEMEDNEDFVIARMAFQYFLNAVFFRVAVPIDISMIIRNTAKMVTLLNECKARAASGDALIQKALHASRQGFDEVDEYVFISAVRCKRADDVMEFLAALVEQKEPAAQPIWDQLRVNDYLTMLLVSAIWLPEVKAPIPNWTRAFFVLDLTIKIGLARGASALAANAYRAKAIVVKEYKPNGEDAETILAEANRNLGGAHPIILDYLAKTYMLDGRFAEALQLWRKITPEEDQDQPTARVFTQREAIMCAANLDEWALAAEYALEGMKNSRRLSHLGSAIAVGFSTENAFALWKQGELQKALESFARVIEALSSLPNPESNIHSYSLHFKVLHTLKWIGRNTVGAEKQIQPAGGWFTDQLSESSREKPVPPYLFYWYYLADAEHKANVDAGILTRLETEQVKVDLPSANTMIEILRIKSSLRSGHLDNLIDQFARFARNAEEVRSSAKAPDFPTFNTELLISIVFAALVMLVGQRKQQEIPVHKWMSDGERHGLTNNVAGYLAFVERVVGANEGDLLSIFKDQNSRLETRLVSDLLLSTSRNLDPATRFVANVLIVTSESSYQLWREELEPIIENLVVDGWEITVEQQRFALLTPRTSVPQILGACRDVGVAGLQKAAQILLAVQNAVSVNLPAEVTRKLSSLANLA